MEKFLKVISSQNSRSKKIQNHVQSSIPLILRVFFEFSNLSKTPKIIFFGQNFFLADVFQYGEHFYYGFEKIRETSIFEPFLHVIVEISRVRRTELNREPNR